MLDSADEFNIETFDLIGFKGSEFISKLIIHIQRNALHDRHFSIDNFPEISHVGLAIHGKDMKPFMGNVLSEFCGKINESEIYVFESTASGTPFDRAKDVFKQFHFGVQLRSLNILIDKYPGKIYWSSKLFKTNEDHYLKLANCIKDLNHKPFEKSLKVLLSNFCEFSKVKQTKNSFFCSELVARILQRSNILPRKINPEKVVPFDFYIDPRNPEKTLDVDGEVPILYKNPVRIKFVTYFL